MNDEHDETEEGTEEGTKGQAPEAEGKPRRRKRRQEPASAAWRNVGGLRPHPKNPRVMERGTVDALIAGMRRFGFPAPVVVWAGRDIIVAGHARVSAVTELLTRDPDFAFPGSPGPGFIPVREVEFASESEALAYLLADNKTHELAAWEAEGLRALLAEGEAAGAGLGELGWADHELGALAAVPPPVELPIYVPPPRPEANTSRAELAEQLALEVRFRGHVLELTIPEAQQLRAAADRYAEATGTYEAFGDELARRF